MIEIIEALEKYTVVQLIMSVPILLIVLMIIKELKSFRISNGKPQPEEAIDTTKVFAEAIGKLAEVISGPLQNVTTVLEGIAASQARHEIAANQANTDKNSIIETGIASIDKLDGNVITMTTEFEHLKTAIETTLKQISEGGMNLSEETQQAIIDGVAGKLNDTMKECINDAIQKITQEVPPVPKAKPGVPVTPKPTDDEPKQEKPE